MNPTQKASLAKRIDETKQKIAAMRESKNTVPSLGVAFLIETDMEKASLIMGAKNIASDLQSQAEKLAKVEADQVMPIIDQLKATFGNEAAEGFYRSVTAAIRELVDQIQKTKDVINDQIMSLENGAAGLPMNDMQMDAGGDDMPSDDLAAPPEGELGDDAMGDVPPAPEEGELDDEMPTPDDDAFADDMSNAAGRARREGAEKFEKAILEWFKKSVQLGTRPTAAARIVAEGFKVDLEDVKDLVREAAAAKKSRK